jgi:hypothetical protein
VAFEEEVTSDANRKKVRRRDERHRNAKLCG